MRNLLNPGVRRHGKQGSVKATSVKTPLPSQARREHCSKQKKLDKRPRKARVVGLVGDPVSSGETWLDSEIGHQRWRQNVKVKGSSVSARLGPAQIQAPLSRTCLGKLAFKGWKKENRRRRETWQSIGRHRKRMQIVLAFLAVRVGTHFRDIFYKIEDMGLETIEKVITILRH